MGAGRWRLLEGMGEATSGFPGDAWGDAGSYVKAGGPGVSQRREAFPRAGFRIQTSAALWLWEGKGEGEISSMASG